MNEESELEDLIRDGAPHGMPPQFRKDLLARLHEATPDRERKVVSFPRLPRFLAIAAVLLLALVPAALWLRPSPAASGPQASNVPAKPPVPDTTPEVASPGSNTVPPASRSGLEPVSLVTREIGSRPASEVIDVNGYPVRLFKSYELATREYKDPDSGSVVQISYPQTQYHFATPSIQ